jgi:hypothetical protein
MKSKLQWTVRGLALLATGGAVLQSGSCLPKNYFANFAANGRNFLLSAAAETLYNSIAEAVIPGFSDVDTNGTE